MNRQFAQLSRPLQLLVLNTHSIGNYLEATGLRFGVSNGLDGLYG